MTEDWRALRRLAVVYARAVDRRDVDAFLSVFAEDATLAVFGRADDPEPRSVRTGHDELAVIPGTGMDRYVSTTHLLGQSDYAIDGASATGEVHCVAHHRTLGPAPSDRVLYIRYDDSYRRDGAGLWTITARRVLVDWAERRPIEPTP